MEGDVITLHTQQVLHEAQNLIAVQREEILKAFIAKYKCNPEEVEQVVEQSGDRITWRVRKIDEYE